MSWPSIWKAETVSAIPKNPAPSGLSELRNLSCTPLYSKVLESFILEKLKEETSLSPRQYGGIKGSSTEHFLTDTWNDILTSLEEKDVVANLISVDFSKAFNRMNHFKCLEALEKLGASSRTVSWVACFLYNRTMSVKIGSTLSSPRTAPGGSPQGSILGNFLFCATTNCFTELTGESTDPSNITPINDEELMDEYIREIEEYTTSTPSNTNHSTSAVDLTDITNSDIVEYNYFNVSGSEEEDSNSENGSETVDENYIPPEHNSETKSYVYIDDFNAVETVNVKDVPMHLTTQKTRIVSKAIKSERLFARINTLAGEIGMQVNSQKTQMLCINPRNHLEINTYLEHNNELITSSDTMKILGFTFDSRPNASRHVETTIEKFHSRLWTLRFLKKSGLDEGRLLEI